MILPLFGVTAQEHSCFSHMLAVNEQEMRRVRPGSFAARMRRTGTACHGSFHPGLEGVTAGGTGELWQTPELNEHSLGTSSNLLVLFASNTDDNSQPPTYFSLPTGSVSALSCTASSMDDCDVRGDATALTLAAWEQSRD